MIFVLKASVSTLRKWVQSGIKDFSEVNVTTETDNYGALKMYRNVGFKEDYAYTQAYLPVSK